MSGVSLQGLITTKYSGMTLSRFLLVSAPVSHWKGGNRISILNWSRCLNRHIKDLEGCETILEFGCGKYSTITLNNMGKYRVGVDIFPEYIEESKRNHLRHDHWLGDMEEYPAPLDFFDAVYFGSVVEHLDKDKAIRMLNKAKTIARKVVIVVTTNGFINHNETDGNPYQKHKCGFTVEDFQRLGFEVYGDLGLKCLSGENGKVRISPVKLGATIRCLTEYVTYSIKPEWAFNLYAVFTKKGRGNERVKRI